MPRFILSLAGVDHHLTEHLSINLLGGPSFRFFKNDGNTINPYAELKVSYQGSNHSLSWITTYGVEQPSQTLAAGATTLRTGLNLTYDLTSRLNSKAGMYYHHEENQAGTGGTVVTTSTGSQDSLYFTLGLKYTINKHFALHADYEYHTRRRSFVRRSLRLLAESLFRRSDLYLLRICRRDSSSYRELPGQGWAITLSAPA